MKMIGPLAPRSTPATSCDRWIRSLVRHIDTIAGTMISAPSVTASTELPGFCPRSVPRARPEVAHLAVDVVPPEEVVDPERDEAEPHDPERVAELRPLAAVCDCDFLGHKASLTRVADGPT